MKTRLLILLCCWSLQLIGQQTSSASPQDFIPFYNSYHPVNYTIDRLDITQDSFVNVHTAIRQYGPATLAKFYNNSKNLNEAPSPSPRKGFLNTFYKNPILLYELQTDAFQLGVNLVGHFKVGKETDSGDFIFLNTRGIELYGTLDDKLYFYSTYQENQSNLLNYQQPFIDDYKSFRRYGNYKDYQSTVVSSISGFDYGYAEAYLGYKLTKHSSLTLGHGNHFIGNGERSLLLSDTGPNYFYLKLAVQVWKIHYQSIWGELATLPARLTPNNVLLPKKYMAGHYFSIKPRKNLEIGLYETIIFSRQNNFELQYLNPVIFYRTIEHQLDSPDNVLLGMNLKWNLIDELSIYGQVILDEFNLGQLTSGNQWWGNKFGYQLGIKHIDIAGVSTLDGLAEWNVVRPYTYSHREDIPDFSQWSIANYSHYGQPLAHPLGANFSELILKLRYQPIDRLTLQARYIHTKVGRNTDENFGQDILVGSDSRISNIGITQNQGAQNKINLLELSASFSLFTQAYLDILVLSRNEANSRFTTINTTYFSTAFRYNFTGGVIDY